MKTIKDHLSTLPEPYRTQALENYEKHPTLYKDQKYETVNSALFYGFHWSDTKQGYDYWEGVCSEI